MGRIINISSVNGQKGQFGQTNYSTAKAGIHGFTMALAQEVASKGVTVNTISPGYIGTDMVRAIRPDVLRRSSPPSRCRLGTPEEIASITAWLASDESGFRRARTSRSTAAAHGLTHVGPPVGGPGAGRLPGDGRPALHLTYPKPERSPDPGQTHDASTNRRQPAPD